MHFPITFVSSSVPDSPRLVLTRYTSQPVASRSLQVIGLLKVLGVPRQLLYVRRIRENGSFWRRKINHLQILEQARQLYRRQVVRAHPDKPGGNLERTVRLNVLWDQIERHFKRHGHELW
jgi:hypothetical protein